MSSVVHRYHNGTKHQFHQFARSLGYLDWASPPAPFRSFPGAPVFALFPSPAAELDASLDDYGPSFIASSSGQPVFSDRFSISRPRRRAPATGIRCFYDDPVHDTLGLQGHACQSLYHFTVGIPVEDARLTSAPGYVCS